MKELKHSVPVIKTTTTKTCLTEWKIWNITLFILYTRNIAKKKYITSNNTCTHPPAKDYTENPQICFLHVFPQSYFVYGRRTKNLFRNYKCCHKFAVYFLKNAKGQTQKINKHLEIVGIYFLEVADCRLGWGEGRFRQPTTLR